MNALPITGELFATNQVSLTQNVVTAISCVTSPHGWRKDAV